MSAHRPSRDENEFAPPQGVPPPVEYKGRHLCHRFPSVDTADATACLYDEAVLMRLSDLPATLGYSTSS
jgi:hypothetical protein